MFSQTRSVLLPFARCCGEEWETQDVILRRAGLVITCASKGPLMTVNHFRILSATYRGCWRHDGLLSALCRGEADTGRTLPLNGPFAPGEKSPGLKKN